MRVIYGGSYFGLSWVGARVYDIKKKHGVDIKGWKDKERPALTGISFSGRSRISPSQWGVSSLNP